MREFYKESLKNFKEIIREISGKLHGRPLKWSHAEIPEKSLKLFRICWDIFEGISDEISGAIWEEIPKIIAEEISEEISSGIPVEIPFSTLEWILRGIYEETLGKFVTESKEEFQSFLG